MGPAALELSPNRRLESASSEILQALFELPAYQPGQPESAILASELDTECESVSKANRLIGAVACSSSVELELSRVESPIESLCEAIQLAAQENEDALKIVEVNARTDVIERTIKTGHVMDPVPLVRNAQGRLIQHGQTLESVQENSLRYAANDPTMRGRVEAETRNAYRMEALSETGVLEDYDILVISLAEDLPEAGFFTESMSCALQLTSLQDGALETETGFVAGIAKPGDEPHDLRTARTMGRKLGVSLVGKTKTDVLDTLLLVPKSRTENGVIDMVKLWDESVDSEAPIFFGEEAEPQDYIEFRVKCSERERGFQPKVKKIMEELVAEAPQIKTPLQAVQRLHKISEKHMVEFAIDDNTIDPRVFGPAAEHIELARAHQAEGNSQLAQAEVLLAQAKAVSNSCPNGLKNGLGDGGEDSDEFGSLTFTCSNGHHNRRKPGKENFLTKCGAQGCKAKVSC
jgi:hypothetical protein